MTKINHFLSSAVLFTFSAIATYGQDGAETLNPKTIKVVADSVGRLLTRYYIFPEKGRTMEKHIQSKLRSGAYKNFKKPADLARQLHIDLQQVNPDIHMAVQFDPWFDKMQTDRLANKEVNEAMELQSLTQTNFLLKRVEVYDGNIGYVYLTGFNRRIKESKPTLHAAMTFLKNTSAVIIDLRENNGGSPEMVREIESYFFLEKQHMMDIVDRVDDKTYQMWTDPMSTDGLQLSMPVYVLTSHATASAAEDFAYGMQAAKRALIVGETTAGGAHLTQPFPAGHNFVVAIPFARSVNPNTKSNWEGSGVKPDIEIAAADALQKTFEVIFEKQISAAADDQAKRKVQWVKYKVGAAYADQQLPEELISSYAGMFEGLEFYTRDGRLLCKNAERGSAIFSMQRISDTHFILDENVIVEFVKDDAGKFPSINMLWKDGWVTKKIRSR